MRQHKNVIFWGAGATRSLGMRVTADQGKFLKILAGADKDRQSDQENLKDRLKAAFEGKTSKHLQDAFYDMITILGDDLDNESWIDTILPHQIKAMKRNVNIRKEDKLRSMILHHRIHFDWPALKAIIRICPGVHSDNFKVNDLFNILDLHIPSGAGFRTPFFGKAGDDDDRKENFLNARRLIGAKAALHLIINALFYIDWQECIRNKNHELNQYKDFALVYGRMMQKSGKKLASKQLDRQEFYKDNTSFVSLNYDPILLWLQFCANRELNNNSTDEAILKSSVPIHLFHDFGHLIPARRIGNKNPKRPLLWYPMNEAVAQRLNKAKYSDARVRLTKFLFPHGCLCWRECPDCGKLSAYHGDEWEIGSSSLFLPPPFWSFDKSDCPNWLGDNELDYRRFGEIDVRECLHCETLTHAEHTQTIMQSSFKSAPPSFIEEIQRDLRATVMDADHIIFMGYSLPDDDVTYRAFFAARCNSLNEDKAVRCTIINYNSKKSGWYNSDRIKEVYDIAVVKSACDIFGEKNVRFYGGGIPNVFMEKGKVTERALQKLLNWQ